MNEPTDKIQSSLGYIRTSILDSHETKLKELIKQGWEVFYREIFGDEFVDNLDSIETEDRYHTEALEWHWEARLALLNGDRPPNGHFAYFPTWPRGWGKTTLGRYMLLTDAMLTFAFGQRGYALVPGGTRAKIKTSAMSLEQSLHTPAVVKWCPALSRVEKNVMGRSRGWTADFISTQAGYVFHFIGLDAGVAGANLDSIRPSFIMPDDIDTRDQSPVIAENRFRIFTTEVLPTGQANTLTYWAQNIINRFSVRYRVEKQQVAILVDRKPTQPIPAVRHPVFEKKTVVDPQTGVGIVQDVLVAGQSTWRRRSLQSIQDEINRYGRDAFESEMQHNVEASKTGLLLHAWRDDVHVISWSQFEAATGYDRMPAHWHKEWGNDWARTKTRYHANVAFWRCVSPQNAKLPGFTFIFHPMSFPANSPPEDVAERLLSCLEPGPLGQEREKNKKTWTDIRRDELIRTDALSHAKTDLERITFERQAVAEIFPQYVAPVLAKHKVLGGVNSHEKDDVRLLYNRVYGLKCVGVNPGKYGGLDQINRDLAIDPYTDHPVIPDKKGFTRCLLVVPDAIDAPEYDDATPEQRVAGFYVRETILVRNSERRDFKIYPPKKFVDTVDPENLHDDDLFRHQAVNYKTRPATVTITGEIVDDPVKADDDFPQCWMMCVFKGPLQNAPLTIEEEIDMLIPEEVRVKAGEPMTRARQQQLEAATFFAHAQLETKYGDELEDMLSPEEEE